MNQIAWQIYGGSNRKANTFIGGVASVITTSGALASRLGIASNRITNFKIVGSDIECRISGSYGIPQFCTGIELLISYYRDFDGLVTSIGSLAFYWTNVREVYTPNATSIGLGAFDQNGSVGQDKSSLKILYIPRVTTIGTTALNNNVFRGNTGKPKIYAHPSLQTINSGSVEGDLAFAIADGATVIYVTNFTAPNTITNLSVGTTYGTAIQLNFTVPTGSANAIDYYEVYVNGVYKNTITASGQYITGLNLNTTYTIEVKPVDILCNKSTSNLIAVTTMATGDVDAENYIVAANLSGVELDSAYQLITDLKTAGLWTKIQALYPFKGTTAAQHKWNAKNIADTNAAFRLTFNGTNTYSNMGYMPNGLNGYANTYFIPNANQNINSNGVTVVIGTNNTPTTNDVWDLGSFNSSTQSVLFVSKRGNANNKIEAGFNVYPSFSIVNIDSKGVYTAEKTSSTVSKVFKNSVVLDIKSGGGTLPTINNFIGCLNYLNGQPISFSNQRIQIVAFHEGLSDTEVATLHAIIDTSEAIAGRKNW